MKDKPYRAGDSFPVEAAPEGSRLPAPPLWQGYVFVSLNSRVVALHRDDGEERWMWRGKQTWITLLLDGDRLIVGANGYVTCLDPGSGQEIWQNPLRGKGLGVMGMAGVQPARGPAPVKPPPYADLIFLSLNKRVVALERGSGALVWEWSEGRNWTSLFLDGDRLIVGSNGYVTCLDPGSGREIWHNPLKGHGFGCMALVSLRGAAVSAPTQLQHNMAVHQGG